MLRTTNIIFSFLGFFLLSFGLPLNENSLAKRIEKKINKEITAVFSVADFTLETSSIQIESNQFLLAHSIREIKVEGQLAGYAFTGTAPSKTDSFDYLILFDPTFTIKKATVLVYREDYGGEISSKRWLSQFVKKQTGVSFIYGDTISAISGATISVQSMTASVNHVFSSLKDVQSTIGQ